MTTTTSSQEIAEQFEASTVSKAAEARPASYNIAPTQDIVVVTQREDAREVRTMRWGLVPFFSKDKKSSARMINARAESVPTKPAYRQAFKKRRCIIPADGYYEWEKIDSRTKQPWFFRPKVDDRTSARAKVFAFAGLWEVWHDPQQPEDAEPLISCTIITTEANKDVDRIHDRMPLELTPDQIQHWLDPNNADLEQLQGLLTPPGRNRLDMWKISAEVNRVANDCKELLLPVEDEKSRLFGK